MAGRLSFPIALTPPTFPQSATEFITNTGSSSRSFATVTRSNFRTRGCSIGTPWEIVRPEHATEIQVYGYVENIFDDRGNYVPRWTGWKKLLGIPYDIPVPGYGTNTVNFLRLWESRAPEEFDFEAFNRGGYEEAVREKNHSETISKVLYPERQDR